MNNDQNTQSIQDNQDIQDKAEFSGASDVLPVENPTDSNVPDKLSDHAQSILNTLNENDISSVDSFGNDLTNKNIELSVKTLSNVQNKNQGSIGKQLTELSLALKDLPDQSKNQSLFSRLFHKAKMSSYELQAKYQDSATTITNIGNELQANANKLQKNNKDMERIYQERVAYYKQLTDYINAGEAKIKQLKEHDLPEAKRLSANADEKDKFDAERKYTQLKNYEQTLEQKVFNLRSVQALAYEQIHELNMIGSSNKTLINSINTSITTAIPTWYMQATTNIFLTTQKEANDANNAVIKATNEMIKQTSESTKNQTIDIVRNSQSPVIKTEALETSYSNLLTAIKDSQDILEHTEKAREEGKRRLLEINDRFHKQLSEALTNDDTGLIQELGNGDSEKRPF